MKKISQIVLEEVVKLINEFDDYDYYEKQEEIKREILSDFLYNNNNDFTKHIPWRVVPFNMLKKVWEDYIKYGFVRHEKPLYTIENIVTRNIIKIDAITNFAGHTQFGDEETLEDYIGYFVDEQLTCILEKPVDKNQLETPFDDPTSGHKIKDDSSKCNTTVHPFIQKIFDDNYEEGMERDEIRKLLYDEMLERFYVYYTSDKNNKMGGFISDYGLKPLLKLLSELKKQEKPENRLVTIDKILNVVHQRSDIAYWFVEGGSNALSQLSGYGDSDEDSVISGSYRMSDYS